MKTDGAGHVALKRHWSVAFLCGSVSAIFLVVSFPPFDVWFLGWVGLIPWFFSIDGMRPVRRFMISYGIGVIFFAGTMYWFIHVTLPGMVLIVLYLALYFGIFGLLFGAVSFVPQGAIITVPASWVALEYIRSYLFTGFGWALLGYSQYRNLPIIQIADTVGSYGVSFLMVMFNVGLFLASRRLAKKNLVPLAVAVLCVIFVFAYGMKRLNAEIVGDTLSVSVIQGNIPQREKWDARFREQIIATYEELSRKASPEKPDLIVWPETAVPVFFQEDDAVRMRVIRLVRELSTSLLAGVPMADKEGEYNSAVLFSKDGTEIDRYDKIRLVPFGEYIPLKNIFSFVQRFAPSPIGDFERGRALTVFSVPLQRRRESNDAVVRFSKHIKFSCLICFEDLFPDLARQFALGGAQFLVNMTNDGWFLKSAAPLQHAQASVFRAVETRLPVVRSANTGLSCFIDQKGAIVGAIAGDRHDIFVKGFLTRDIVTPMSGRTAYVRYGDVFAYAMIVITVLAGFAGWRRT